MPSSDSQGLGKSQQTDTRVSAGVHVGKAEKEPENPITVKETSLGKESKKENGSSRD